MLPAARRTNKRPVRRRVLLTPRKLIGPLFCVILLCLLAFGVYHAGEHLTQDHKKTQKQAKVAPIDTQTPKPQADAALNQIIASWARQYSFKSSVVVTELTGNLRSASYNPTSSVVPASTYKIYVAYALLHGIEQGGYTLNTKTDDGNTILTDLQNMILNSDNDAARTLGFLYGWKNINTLLQSQGINSTNLYNYVPPSTLPIGDKHTTATDLATVLNKLYNGQLLNQTNTQLLLNLLETQHYRERIPAGVPSGVTVADKPGWLGPADGESGYTENDAAIVYGPKSTYILVITTTGSATQPLADLSKLVYNHLEL